MVIVGFSLYALTDVVRYSLSDPSNGREYRPPTWPPPPEQRNQLHPKSVRLKMSEAALKDTKDDVTS